MALNFNYVHLCFKTIMHVEPNELCLYVHVCIHVSLGFPYIYFFIFHSLLAGNGPSGISLSYILSGNWPYFTGEPHPNPILQPKLEENPDQSILELVSFSDFWIHAKLCLL